MAMAFKEVVGGTPEVALLTEAPAVVEKTPTQFSQVTHTNEHQTARVFRVFTREVQPHEVPPLLTAVYKYLERLRERELSDVERYMERQRRISEQGCATRALAFAGAAKPTDGQWDMRLQQIDAGSNTVTEADQKVIDLIQQYQAQKNTPLGESLSRYDVSVQNEATTEEDISNLMGKGNRVMVIGTFQDGTRHMAYVGHKRGEKGLFMLSDQGKPALETGGFRVDRTIVLTPKDARANGRRIVK